MNRFTDSPVEDQPLPGTGVRTLLSFLLFLHLFALFVACVSNSAASPLQRRLRYVPAAYLQLLNMDLSYGFHLTQAELSDVDYVIEMELETAGGKKTVRLPPSELGPPIRYRRYERLGWLMADRVAFADTTGDASMESLLPQAIAARLFLENDARRGTLRCMAHRLQSMDDAASTDPKIRNPFHPSYYFPVYTATVWLDDQDRVQISKLTTGVDVAPAATEP
jgi:hypothetical protein